MVMIFLRWPSWDDPPRWKNPMVSQGEKFYKCWMFYMHMVVSQNPGTRMVPKIAG